MPVYKTGKSFRRKPQTVYAYLIDPLPTEKLVMLAKAAIDELQKRLVYPQQVSHAGPDVTTDRHPNGRTLRYFPDKCTSNGQFVGQTPRAATCSWIPAPGTNAPRNTPGARAACADGRPV